MPRADMISRPALDPAPAVPRACPRIGACPAGSVGAGPEGTLGRDWRTRVAARPCRAAGGRRARCPAAPFATIAADMRRFVRLRCRSGCFAIALVIALAGALAGCGTDADRTRSAVLSECRLPRLAIAAQCGSIEVPENRDRPDGRNISIAFAVLPANTLSPKPDPLVLLPGGPGQSASALVPFASRLVEVRRTRDIVLIDPRGAGRSAPLDCEALKPEDTPGDVLDTDPVPKAQACLEELAGRGVDASQYTTAAWVADLEAVRAALGYPTWNLWGGSYGTRVALEYARRHAARVRAMILDGVAPPSLKISLGVWLTREQALDALFAACAASPGCAAAESDLAATLARIRADLGPTGRDVTVANPRTGETETHRVTFEVVVAGLHPLVYLPELAAVIPALLARAAIHGRKDGLHLRVGR